MGAPAIDRSTYWLGKLVASAPALWFALGRAESTLLEDKLETIAIDAPIYVGGLARSGSTIVLEMLAAHSQAASHRYQDFPFIPTPYVWGRALQLNPARKTAPAQERAHGDGMLITPQSPEAMEEALWMHFFPQAHRGVSHTLDGNTSNPRFERFYRNHIRKLLLLHNAQRYVCKSNYVGTRMGYLRTIFPDARFIIPVREPANHIASLMRQHKRFCELGSKDPRIVEHMDSVGHFEFGLHRKPIHTGDTAAYEAIRAAWENGDELGGWAILWATVYAHIHAHMPPGALLLHFESLYTAPEEAVGRVLEAAGLPQDEALVARFAAILRKPDYYESGFTPQELARIREITAKTARLLGY